MNADNMPLSNADNLTEQENCSKTRNQGDSYSQNGNMGIGHAEKNEIKDNAQIIGEKNEHNHNQSQSTNINLTVNNNLSNTTSDIDNHDTQTITIEKGDTKVSFTAPHTPQNYKDALSFLQNIAKDTVRLEDIEKSSIKLTLKGSEEGLKNIVKSFESGELAPILKNQFNLELQDVQLIDSEKDKNQDKQNSKLLALTIAGDVSQAYIDSLKSALINSSEDEKEIKKREEKNHFIKEINSEIQLWIKKLAIRIGLGSIFSKNLSRANLSRADVSGAYLSRANLIGANLSRANLIGANLIGANLSCANLSRANLSRADLSRANLSGANLIGANLSGANLSGANLSGANLSVAYLSRANLSRANLSRADLSRANLIGANLSGANLSGANLIGANLSGANLSGANLSRANLSRADLSDAYLSRADLSDANLSRANLSGAYLSRANLRNSIIDDKTILNIKWKIIWEIINQPQVNRDLSNCDLSYAYLEKVELNNCRLVQANLEGSYLNRANLSGSNLVGANLRNADLREANLTDVDLSGANVKNTSFAHNQGISASLKQDLIARGAIFEDSQDDKVLNPHSPVPMR